MVLPSALAITVTINERMLQPVVSAPAEMSEKTRGLMGNNNENKDDDLQAFNGTFLSPNSTEEEIYYWFGLSWTVPQNETKFSRNFSEPVPDFIPFFWTSALDLFNNNQTLVDQAIAICKGEIPSCLFDYKVTLDAAAAAAGNEANSAFNEQQSLMCKSIKFNPLPLSFKSSSFKSSLICTLNVFLEKCRFIHSLDLFVRNFN